VAEMRRLVFGEGLMTPSLDGEKRFTVRKYREGSHDFKKGEIVIGEFKDGLDILIQITADTKKNSFEHLKRSKRDLDKNGYWFDDEYFEDLKQFPGYQNLTWDTMGAVIFFEVLKINGVPAVRINQHAKEE